MEFSVMKFWWLYIMIVTFLSNIMGNFFDQTDICFQQDPVSESILESTTL